MLTESSCSGIRKHLTFLNFTFPSYLRGGFFLRKNGLWQNWLHDQHAPPPVQKWSPDSNDRSIQKGYTSTIVHLYQHTWHYLHQFAPRKNQVYKQAKRQTWVQPNKRSSRRRGHESATNPRPWSVTLRHQDMSNTSKLILECLANATSVLSPACTQQLALCTIIPCDTHLPNLTSSIHSSLAANM